MMDDDSVDYLYERDVIALVHNLETILNAISIMQARELKLLIDDIKQRREWISDELVLEGFDWLKKIALRRGGAARS